MTDHGDMHTFPTHNGVMTPFPERAPHLLTLQFIFAVYLCMLGSEGLPLHKMFFIIFEFYLILFNFFKKGSFA